MTTATIPTAFECPPGRSEPAYIRHDGCEPGVRMVAGKPWIYDATDLRAYREDVAVFHAPSDLASLPYEAHGPDQVSLTGLKYAVQGRIKRLRNRGRSCPVTDAFAKRLWAEIPTRPEYQRAFGSKARRAEAA